jgi:uncharacterized protein YecE (DUF72 family)
MPTRRAARVFVGTSGFSYPAWRGSFYPERLPPREMLGFYARQLSTVEINHTFRRLPTPALLSGWARQTPPRFRFALKAPQRITHVLRLRDAGEPTREFCRIATRLGPKLGPLLFQLPPYARFDAPRLADFLETLPVGVEPAFEFRHESWFVDATWTVLSEHRPLHRRQRGPRDPAGRDGALRLPPPPPHRLRRRGARRLGAADPRDGALEARLRLLQARGVGTRPGPRAGAHRAARVANAATAARARR